MKRHLAFFDPKPGMSSASESLGSISEESKKLLESHNKIDDSKYRTDTLNLMNEQLQEEQKVVSATVDQAKELQSKIDLNNRRATESMASGMETVETSADYENLATLLENLAKNKNVNYPWTNDSWKGSAKETSLALGSAKVFQELLNANSLRKMVDVCSNHKGDLSRQEAEQLKKELGINSKAKDIQSFYQSYQEYKKNNTEYQHLKGLMAFFLENGIDSADKLAKSLSNRSRGITNTEISGMGRRLFREVKGHRTYFDAYEGKEVEHKPSDWRQKASFEIVKSRLEDESNKDMLQSEKMLALLGDFNFDGEVNDGDTSYKTGSQFADVFRMVLATAPREIPGFNSDVAVKNLVAYAKKCGVDLPNNISSVDELYQWMTARKPLKAGYENTVRLQNFLKNLPIDLGDVLKNGSNAGKQSLDGIVAAAGIEQENEKLVSEAAMQKVKEVIDANKQALQEAFPDENVRRNVTQQLMAQLPGMLIEQAMNQKSGLALGTEIPLDQLIKGTSIGLGIGVDAQGKPSFGLFFGWDHSKKEGIVDSSIAVDVGANVKIENISDLKGLFFVNLASVSIENGFDLNEGKRNATLDATGLKRFSIGENVGVGLLAGIPQITWGVNVGYENDKLAGIESQAENIRNVVSRHAETWLNLLCDQPGDQKGYFRTLLKQSFKDASNESINKAADNIYSVIEHFASELNKDTSEDAIKTYAKIISDVFTEQWRNAAVQGIADNKARLKSGKFGVQLFNLKPAYTLVAKFTRYCNERTEENKNSQIRRIDAEVNGTGNRQLELGESGELGAEDVKRINGILVRYGAKENALGYIPGEGGKPGRIQVPASLVGAGLNVHVSQSLDGYVQSVDEGAYYTFPANTVYRIFQETGGNKKSMTLNIGAAVTNIEHDISISNKQGMDALIGTEELMGETRLEFTDKSEYVEVDKVLDYQVRILELFTPEVTEGLKRIDSKNWKRFSQFMKNKRDADVDFQQTVDALIACLNDKKFDAIKEKLKPGVSNVDRQLIVDRIMAISAEANVHNKYGLEAVVNGNREVKGRGEYYKKESMVGPNGEPIFNKINVDRNALIKEIEATGNEYKPELQTNLLGATAFYHKNNDEKGLALTGLGATTVLGGKMREIIGEDRTKVENWFLGEGENPHYSGALEMKKSPTEWNNLNNGVSNYIKNMVGEFKTDTGLLAEAQLKNLLRGKEIELNLDNSQEIVKVMLDVKYMFYLMGECANESVGMQLGKLQVMRQQEVQDYRAGQLWLNDQDGSSRVAVTTKDTNIGVSFTVGKNDDELADTTPRTTEVPNSTPGATPDNPGKPENPTPPPVAPENPGGGNETTGGGRD